MVLPSEAHRRRQRQDHRPLSPRLSLSSSISSEMASPSPSPSASSLLLPDDHGAPKELRQASVLSVGDESFDDFTLRMIRQYVRDQDTRARHQVRREGGREGGGQELHTRDISAVQYKLLCMHVGVGAVSVSWQPLSAVVLDGSVEVEGESTGGADKGKAHCPGSVEEVCPMPK